MSFVVGPIIRQGIRSAAKYVYQGLRQQERVIDYTYRKTGLYNRGVVRGIKHGLAGGQIIGGSLSLGLSSDNQLNDYASPLRKQPKTYKSNKARYRPTVRRSRSCKPRYYPRKFRR